MFYEKNVKALLRQKELHQVLLEQLDQTQPTQDYELLPTPDGNYTLHYKGIFLHDPEQPLQEVQNTLKQHCTPGPARLHVILGLGLGYLLEQTYQNSEGYIIVYEPDLKLLRFLLENLDLSEFFESERVCLTGFQSDLIAAIRKKIYAQYQLDLLILRGSAFLLVDEIPDFMEKLKELELDRVHDFNTGKAFHYQWLKQVLDNFPYFAKYDFLDSLVGKFAGKPALVVSRGPSLDRAVDSVKALANSTVIIAVGGAIRRLWEADVTPDFAVFYDANGMQEQLHGIPQSVLENITFIICPSTQRCTFTVPSRGKLLFLSQNGAQYCDWLDQILETKHHRLDGGGTVSIIAFQMAQALQCNPIILVGQDLAFPGNQVYAGGIPLQVNETGHMALPRSETLFAAPETMDTTIGQQGESLPTLKAYKSFIRHFQEMATENAKKGHPVELYNTSLGGAKIDGYTLCDLAEFIPKLSPWKQGPALPEAPILSPAMVESRRNKLQKGLQELRETLQEGIVLFEKIQRDLEQSLSTQTQSTNVLEAQYSRFRDFVRQQPFAGHICLYEHIQFRQFSNTLVTPETLAKGGCQAFIAMLQTCQAIFRDHVIPKIEETEAALQALQVDTHCML
jgi:hypothetical protein